MRSICLTILLASIASSLRCPSQWRLDQSNCYRYYPQTKKFWPSSDFCRQQVFYSAHSTKPINSELVSIHSPDENAFVFSIVPPSLTVQLGLYNNVIKGKRTWHWTDGTPFEYSNWAPGQPDKSIQHYGTMWNSRTPSKWDDAEWPSLSFVCKVPADDCLKSPYEKSNCNDPLGVEDGTIPSNQLTASTEFSTNYVVNRGRLNTVKEGQLNGAWTARVNDQNQWIQADLGSLLTVTGVITQGRSSETYNQWVTSYEVLHSVDGNNLVKIMDASGQVAVFNGNSDQNTLVTNVFHDAVYAQYIRIHPTDWHGRISLRFEVLGCKGSTNCKNGGKISDDGVCICPSPYSCIDCSWYNGCMSNPCQNGGKCMNNEHSYSCECDDGFTGTHCEIYEGCLAFPCMNRGNCSKDLEKAIFVCTCPEDYSGVTCQTYIGHCKEDPCENGGTCHSISVAPFYICQCKPPYIGTTCSATSYGCLNNPCLNGGICVTSEEKNGTSCLCSSDYSGSTCGLQKLTSKADNQTSQSNTNVIVGFTVVTVSLSAIILLLGVHIFRNRRLKGSAFIGLQHELE